MRSREAQELQEELRGAEEATTVAIEATTEEVREESTEEAEDRTTVKAVRASKSRRISNECDKRQK